jgi:hypothetical protein
LDSDATRCTPEIGDSVVTLPAVGDHGRAHGDVFGQKGPQAGGGRIGQQRHPAPSIALWRFELHGHANQ